MEKVFVSINPEKLNKNIFKLVGDEWMLITAGKKDSFNTMTASWGGMGILWNKPVAFIFIRPQRYTFQFVNREEVFTLSFFPENKKEILKYCGRVSGKDTDKVSDCGLSPLLCDHGGIAFEEASLVFVCRKLYFQDLHESGFTGDELKTIYPHKDLHRMYIGEIVSVLAGNDVDATGYK